MQVFRRCQQTWIAQGMAGAFAVGISAQEVAAAEHLAGVELDPDEAEGVQQMGHIAAQILNSRKA